jgi:hypothetical protein
VAIPIYAEAALLAGIIRTLAITAQAATDAYSAKDSIAESKIARRPRPSWLLQLLNSETLAME